MSSFSAAVSPNVRLQTFGATIWPAQQKTRRTVRVGGSYENLVFTAKASMLPWPAIMAETKHKAFLFVWLVLSIAQIYI
jgi:hypothetical protein